MLKGQCLDRRIDNMGDMKAEVARWEKDRNNSLKNIDWQFTPSDARIKLKRLYPKLYMLHGTSWDYKAGQREDRMKANNPTIGITDLLARLWQHLSRRRRRQFMLILGLMIMSAFAEMISRCQRARQGNQSNHANKTGYKCAADMQ